MLVGMTVFTGQYWADRPKVSKEQLAAYIVDLAWHGLSRLDSKPQLRFEGAKAHKRNTSMAADDARPQEVAIPHTPLSDISAQATVQSGARNARESAETDEEVLPCGEEKDSNGNNPHV